MVSTQYLQSAPKHKITISEVISVDLIQQHPKKQDHLLVVFDDLFMLIFFRINKRCRHCYLIPSIVTAMSHHLTLSRA